ncbi:hypothetical protein JVU11DRAFT_2410 [Chiua virens]|nr:hypothetical protein JVU11DRAFT_2410 [Chiua virens]
MPNQDYDTTAPDSGKRSRWPSPETSEPIAQKKARFRFSDKTDESDLESDEDEVEEMIIDESFSQRPRSSRRPNATSREKLKKTRQERWSKNRMAYETQLHDTVIPADGSFSMRVDSDDTLHFQNTPWSTEGNKRKGQIFLQDLVARSKSLITTDLHAGPKRARTSPLRMRNEVNQTWLDKRWSKRRLRKFGEHDRYQGNDTEYSGLYFTPPASVSGVEDDQAEDEATATTTEASSQGTDGWAETPLEANPSHEAEVAESIRKLRELEKDRPLWEAQRKQREARERAEEQERLAKAERRQKEEERLRQQHEAAEREKRRAQEAERLAQEEECRQRENRERRQQRWDSFPWTSRRALEHYRVLCDKFDEPKFTARKSITFHDIPWPVLHAPSRLTVEDVDWSAVEIFFATVKLHMRLQDYKEFVEKSHRRFHPDRWRARKIWTAVADEVERGYLEVAANTVAQAITPIWKAAKED